MLLRAFEPVVRLTQGEYFLPVGVEEYVRHCSLWVQTADDEPRQVAQPGDLDLDELARRGLEIGGPGYSLSGISVPSSRRDRIRSWFRTQRPKFRAGSRLAEVGLTGRAIDTLSRMSLLFRGAVPGGSAVASLALQNAHLEPGQPDVPRPRRPRRRLDRLPVLVLLRLQQLAVGVLRRQRARGRLGAGDHLPRRHRPRRRGRPAVPALGRVLGPRRGRRRPAPALGRPRPVARRRTASRRLRGRGIALGCLPRRRLPHHRGPAAARRRRAGDPAHGEGPHSVDACRAGIRPGHPLHRLRARRRHEHRAGAGARVGRRRHRRRHPVGA